MRKFTRLAVSSAAVVALAFGVAACGDTATDGTVDGDTGTELPGDTGTEPLSPAPAES